MSDTAKVKWSCSRCATTGELNLPEPIGATDLAMAVLKAHGLEMKDIWSEGPDAHHLAVTYRVWHPRRKRTQQSLF